MALEKPTRGKPVKERDFIIGNLQQNSEIFRPTYLNPEEQIFASFSMLNGKKIKLGFFSSLFSASIFMPLYEQTDCTDVEIRV